MQEGCKVPSMHPLLDMWVSNSHLCSHTSLAHVLLPLQRLRLTCQGQGCIKGTLQPSYTEVFFFSKALASQKLSKKTCRINIRQGHLFFSKPNCDQTIDNFILPKLWHTNILSHNHSDHIKTYFGSPFSNKMT